MIEVCTSFNLAGVLLTAIAIPEKKRLDAIPSRAAGRLVGSSRRSAEDDDRNADGVIAFQHLKTGHLGNVKGSA
jgi:hypothetical protein